MNWKEDILWGGKKREHLSNLCTTSYDTEEMKPSAEGIHKRSLYVRTEILKHKFENYMETHEIS